MRLPNFLTSVSRKLLLIILGIIIAGGIVFFIWEKNKYRIVNDKIASTLADETDSLYTIKYDSLYFDEIAGSAYLQNVHIAPDTFRVRNSSIQDLPYILLDIKISSITVTGVKTDKALVGEQMIGDSVVIVSPEIIIYFIKPLQKKTKIDVEAKSIYDEILGKLKRIQVGHVFLNNINIKGSNFFSKEKSFDLIDGNIQLTDVLVDSAHNLDTTRTLFCKQAALQVSSFLTYNNNRPEIRVNKMMFSGKDNLLSFDDIEVNRFESDSADSSRLLHATKLVLGGLNSNEIVKNKNIVVNSITCDAIALYQPPFVNLKKSNNNNVPKQQDSTGFMHVYSIDMKHLSFPKIDFIPARKSGITLGNIAVKINEVMADEIIKVQNYPIDYSKEAEIIFDKISMNSKDGLYNFSIQNASINSFQKQLKVASVNIKPFLGEKAFANKAHFQKDRYDVTLNGISLKGIDMRNLISKKLFASDLIISNASIKIYRDLKKPLDGKSKVGNYLPQLLKKLDVPVNITHASVSNAFIQYTEHEQVSDSSGIVSFNNSSLSISNITNLAEAADKNKTTTVSFNTRVLNAIPLKGEFKFFLDGNAGNFTINGHTSAFNALLLNKVSVPMALIKVNTGTIHSIDFNFTGDDYKAKGDFVMKYSDLKVDVLKRDKDSKQIKKKGLTSLLANVIVQNNNPSNGELRKVHPEYDRNIQKSFFNLVWKNIFTGMKSTVGIP
jgi:hypothetical protein